MSDMRQCPWGYRSLGPWMTSVESERGDFNVILNYDLVSAIRRCAAVMNLPAAQVRCIIIDARGNMVYGYDRRTRESVGTRETTDLFIMLIEQTGDMDAAIAATSMTEFLRGKAQEEGLA